MAAHPFSALPAMPLSRPDRSEEHDEFLCEWCGTPIDSEWGCRCAMVDTKIDDEKE